MANKHKEFKYIGQYFENWDEHLSYSKEFEKFKKNGEKYFTSSKAKEIIYFSHSILRLDKRLEYFNFILRDYLKTEFGEVLPGSKVHKEFAAPIFRELIKVERLLEMAAKGERFGGDFLHTDALELICNVNTPEDNIFILEEALSKNKKLLNMYPTDLQAKGKIKRTIKEIECLLNEYKNIVEEKAKKKDFPSYAALAKHLYDEAIKISKEYNIARGHVRMAVNQIKETCTVLGKPVIEKTLMNAYNKV